MCNAKSASNHYLTDFLFLLQGLENVTLRQSQMTSDFNSPRIDSYRFSMANLEESQDVDLDAILGELSALETQCDQVWESLGIQKLKSYGFFKKPLSRV